MKQFVKEHDLWIVKWILEIGDKEEMIQYIKDPYLASAIRDFEVN